jgi:hypothetical protein
VINMGKWKKLTAAEKKKYDREKRLMDKGICPQHNSPLLYCVECLDNWKDYGDVRGKKKKG